MILGLLILKMVLGLVVGVFVEAGFLLWGASIAKIENRSFGKALGAAILGCITWPLSSWILGLVPAIGPLLGFAGGFLVFACIMMSLFRTTFRKAVVATMLAWVLAAAIVGGVFLLAFIFIGGLAALC